MLLMSKLLKNTILLSSLCAVTLFGSEQTAKYIQKYLTDQIERSPMVKSGKVQIIDQKPLETLKGWDAYIVEVKATVRHRKEPVVQRDIFFSNGKYLTNNLVEVRTGISLKDKIKPKMDPKFYTADHLIFGYPNAQHRVAIFSDPLCPFCRDYVPEALAYMKKYPEKFAVYYYHLPLVNLHPASGVLVKAFIAAELKGKKLNVLDLYKNIQPDNPKGKNFVAYNQRDPKKILKVFNKAMGTNITIADLNSPMVKKHYKADQKIAEDMMIGGTPTVYFDGEFDRLRKKYKSVK